MNGEWRLIQAGDSGAGPVTLPVLRLRSRRPSGRAVLLLSGGPGEPCLDAAARARFSRLVDGLVERADVVLFDQRGVGAAVPSIAPVVRWGLPLPEPGEREQVLEFARCRATASRQFWERRRIDLSAFTIGRSARDVPLVLDALGIGQASLFGHSYGSQLAQAVLALHDPRIDRAVLCNVESLDQTLKRPAIVETALIRAIGAGRIERVTGVIDQLRRSPATVELSPGTTVGIGGFDVQRAVARWIGTRHGLTRLSRAVDDRDGALVAEVAQEIAVWRTGPFGGIQHVVDSATPTSDDRLRLIERERPAAVLGDAADFPLPHVAQAWGIAPDTAIELRTSVPTLLVSGTHDCRTPLENLDVLRPRLADARELVIEGGTHDLLDYLTDEPTRRQLVNHLTD